MDDLDDNPSEELIPSDVHTFSKSDKADLLSSIVGVVWIHALISVIVLDVKRTGKVRK